MVRLNEGSNTLNVQMVSTAAPLASLYGVVTDAATGQRIYGVKVTLDTLVAHTNIDGQYGFEDLEPGDYTVTFEKADYETLVM